MTEEEAPQVVTQPLEAARPQLCRSSRVQKAVVRSIEIILTGEYTHKSQNKPPCTTKFSSMTQGSNQHSHRSHPSIKEQPAW